MLAHQQAREIVVKHLPQLGETDLTFQKLCGLTNVTYAVHVNGQPTHILKSFSDGFDRETENQVVVHLSERQLAAKLIYANDRYRIEHFIPSAGHPTIEDLKSMSLIQKVMQHLYNFHSVDIKRTPETVNPSDFLWTDHQMKQLRQQESFKHVSNYQNLMTKIVSILEQREIWRRKLMPDSHCSLRFCHNDLNNLNILLGDQVLYFIDYDYVGYNYLAYDIANFLNESCINYSVDQYPGFKLEKHFTFEQIAQIARYYPGYYEGLEMQILKFFCVANLYWAIWSIKRYQLNKSSLFGILQHGLARMDLFFFYNRIIEKELSRSRKNSKNEI